MNNPQFKKRSIYIIIGILTAILLVACGTSEPAEESIIEERPPEVLIPETPLEETAPPEPPETSDPVAESPLPSDTVLIYEDMIYPGSEFLFEVDGFGGEMTPWRFYAVYNDSSEMVVEYYKQQLDWFVVESEEVINGNAYLMLAHPEPMGFMDEAEGFEEIQKVSQDMDGSLLGLEVTHSEVSAGLNRLGMAIEMHGISDQIPENTIIIVLEYYQNVY